LLQVLVRANLHGKTNASVGRVDMNTVQHDLFQLLGPFDVECFEIRTLEHSDKAHQALFIAALNDNVGE
jgi:hypothetical protein